MSTFPKPRLIPAALLALGALLGIGSVAAQPAYSDHVRSIEQEYARQNNGRMIPIDQLRYYLDRDQSGWTLNQISQDMASAQRQAPGAPWRPAPDWNAGAVTCSSDNNRYNECMLPFRGTVVLDQQISNTACIEGQSWGQKQGLVWVDRGCRARFIQVADPIAMPPGNRPTIVCQSVQGAHKVCRTGLQGRVELMNRFKNSGACIEGRSWGQRVGEVWVSGNCRARFGAVAMGRPGQRHDDRYDDRWNRDANYSVTCPSEGSRQSRCGWDNRYGSPQLVQRLSQAACVEGRSWGYTPRDGLWVNGGCRARFASR